MLRTFIGTFLSLVFVGMFLAKSSAQTTVLFFDDFESADAVGTILPDTPPVGEDWVLFNSNSTDSFVDANPESEVANTSSLAYHNARPDPPTPEVGVAIPLAPISADSRTLIAANQNLLIEFKYYDTGAQYGLSLIPNDAPVGSLPTGASAGDLRMSNGVMSTATSGTLDQTYTLNDWHDVALDFDFAAETYTVTLDGVLAEIVGDPGNSAVPFVDSVSTITSLWIGHVFRPSDYYIDDLRMSTVGSLSPVRTWNTNGSGIWADFGNWDPLAVPDGDSTTAVFGSVITAPSTVAVDSAVTVNRVEFNNANTYAVAGTGSVTLDVNPTGPVDPTIEVTTGDHQFQVELNLSGNTSVTVTSGSLDFNNQIDLAGNTLNLTGTVGINHSVIDSSGGGSIASLGVLETAGATSISGDLTSTGTLDIDLGGTGTGQADIFMVSGSADLEGLVDVDLQGGFVPTGDVTILSTTGGINLTGALTLSGPDAGLFSGVSVVGNDLVLELAAGLEGDFDGNGIVDGNDFLVWQRGGSPNPLSSSDLALWEGNYGATGSISAATAVPEPTACLLSFTGLGMALCFRRRSH